MLSNMQRIAVYGGSFDPFTNGHLNILKKASNLFDKVILSVAVNPVKKAFLNSFSDYDFVLKQVIEVEMLNNVSVAHLGSTQILVEYAKNRNANYYIDFNDEQNLYNANKSIVNDVETVYLFPDKSYSDISSSLIKALYKLDNWEHNIINLVHPLIFNYILLISANETHPNYIGKVFKKSLDALSISNLNAEGFARRIILEYATARRAYHNIHHIYVMLNYLNLAKDSLNLTVEEEALLTIAILFHDIVYVAGKDDNEEKSFKYFLDHYGDALNKSYLNEINRIILSTKRTLNDTSKLSALIQDLDMIEGSFNVDTYYRNSRLIRKEYSMYNDDQWRKGRIDFLRSNIDKKIFFSELFKVNEVILQDNMRLELEHLENLKLNIK
jgi:pantetheine-phosphate adenylyltransferase